MSKSKNYHFSIGTPNLHSSLWTVIVNNNDFILVSSSEKNETKLTIHESGECHHSFTNEFMQKRGGTMKNQDRHLMRYKLPEVKNRYWVVCSYIFPSSEIVSCNEITCTDIDWVNSPKEGEFLELVVCCSDYIDLSYDTKNSNLKILKTFLGEDKRVFILFYRYCKMTDLELETVEEVKTFISAFKQKHRVEEMLCATAQSFDDELGRRIFEVYD